MAKPTKLRKQLEDIASSNEFDKLNSWTDPSRWEQLNAQDREFLAFLFVLKGKDQLAIGDGKALESFAAAAMASPDNPKVYYSQGIAFAVQNDNMHCLKAACTAMAQAIALDQEFFDAWYAWGNLLTRQGVLQSESLHFHEAHQKFLQASKLVDEAKAEAPATFYWQWGLCWYYLGKNSGEATDYRLAIELFRKASAKGLQDSEFWNDYGNLMSELAFLLKRYDLLFEAVEVYQKSVKLSPDYFEGWLNLACTLQHLYELHKQEDDFQNSQDSFAEAARINSESGMMWMHLGQLLVSKAKLKRDPEILQQSFESFKKADICEPNHHAILANWGEAQMLCGVYSERHDMLRSANEMIQRSLEMNVENSDLWYLYGTCLNELGRYFSDDNFYQKAIEKFQRGLGLDRNNPLLWYGLGLAHFAIGDQLADIEMVEKAARCCAKVIECGDRTIPQFWNDWGVALLKLSELTNEKSYAESAIEKFENAIARHNEESNQTPDLEWLYNYGCALDFLGDFHEDAVHYEKAVQVLSKVVQTDPSYTHARYNLALALSHLGEAVSDIEFFYKAIEHYQVLLNRDPEDEMAWNDCGLTLLNLAQLMQDPLRLDDCHKLYVFAESKFMHAASLGNTQAYYNLACLYSLCGNFSAAMHFIERAEASSSLPALDDVMNDEWLEGLRNTHSFRNFISHLSTKREEEK